ncbi:MAG TPA: Gfo/Idh/MocA family oxidoreductase [Gemmatimonadales bacterium]|nr:Gfo/Idh/MocA family oxidoreductase [Gemmatimonadales bacterium]
MARKRITRRKFVGDVGAGVAFTIVPRQVLGRGYRAPSDTLNIACIGVGGMGANDVKGVGKTENVYALCDVDDKQATQSFAAFPKAKRFKDFRVMFEKEGKHIDAVTVSTPDHTHTVTAMLAMKLGKHTYCQKPLARTLWEVRQLEQAARRYKVATQMGNQGHAQDGTRFIREWVEAGAIGTVREIHYWTNRPIWPQAIDRPLEDYYTPPWLDWDLWLGPAALRPYHPAYAPFKWRGWWDFGTGALGDIACHSMDAAFWTLGLGFPTRVEPEATKLFSETAPACSRIVYHFPARGTRREIKVVWRDGSLSPPRPKEVGDERVWPPDSSGQLWIGDGGKLVAGIYGDEPRLLDEARQAELIAHPVAQQYPRTQGVYAEWIAACKGGPPAGSNFADHAGPLTEMVLLGNLAVRAGQVLETDPETGQVRNVKLPDEYMRPTYRSGWTL